MLQINTLRENKESVIKRLAIKNIDATAVVEKILALDADRRKIQTQVEGLQAESNLIAKQVGDLYKAGKKDQGDELKAKSATLKNEIKSLDEALAEIESQQHQFIIGLPNTPHESVPHGNKPEDNLEVLRAGEIPQLPASAKPHWELAQQYNIIDFELGVKITGAGFPVYKGYGARLQRALLNFFLDQAGQAGYLEIQPPTLVNAASGFGTGQLPDKEGQMYHVQIDDLYLIPTAEVPITNLYRDVVLNLNEMPIKNCGYTNCFRREAGSYGKDVRGLNRLHQFDKVEIVQVVHPDHSYQVLEQMKDYVAGLLQKLELPFRILKLCGGDMSFASALTYDLEVYSAAQQKWLEVSSVSNFESFQSNRLKLRYKDADGKNHLAHTLNGSALAFPRIVASLLENNQSQEGIRIPKALVPYTGFEWIKA